ncbi:MAG: methylenetetrahydrofolate reductase [Nanoarchaeota archaeon]|nr:methylenetetrahydrofolate reductase [Nanoarchaeota archaeon]
MNLEQKLKKNIFVKTLEIVPPKGVDVSKELKAAKKLKNTFDAFNITDNQRSTMRMSSLTLSALFVQSRLEPIMQLNCRDKNRLALQSDILGAYPLGIRNILAITGDSIKTGDDNNTRQVFDIDSVQLLFLTSGIEKGTMSSGKTISSVPSFFKGCVVNPNSDFPEGQLVKLKKKIDAGAQFCQTQAVFDSHILAGFLKRFEEFGIEKDDVMILAGVFILPSAKVARFISDNLPGNKIPEKIIERMENAADQKREGIRIAQELISQFQHEVAGVHIMSMGRYDHLEKLF